MGPTTVGLVSDMLVDQHGTDSALRRVIVPTACSSPVSLCDRLALYP